MIDPNNLPDQMEFLVNIPERIVSPVVIPQLADALEFCPAASTVLWLISNLDAPIPPEMRLEIARTMLKQSMALAHHRQDAFYRAAMRA